jgi:hypothetical protein
VELVRGVATSGGYGARKKYVGRRTWLQLGCLSGACGVPKLGACPRNLRFASRTLILAPHRDARRRKPGRSLATPGPHEIRPAHPAWSPLISIRLRCCNAARVPGESARCVATSSSSRRPPSRMSTTSSCPHHPSLATRSRQRSEDASSPARSRCQPKASTPARSSAVSPELDSWLAPGDGRARNRRSDTSHPGQFSRETRVLPWSTSKSRLRRLGSPSHALRRASLGPRQPLRA